MLVKCDVCNAEFRRSEHLNRHLLRHLGVRPFSCSVCGASFSRRDSLQRHTQSHVDSLSSASENSAPGRSRRTCVSRACRDCARSKQRCDGLMPCERCQNKGRACVYMGESRRSTSFSSGTTVQGTDIPHDNDHLITSSESSLPLCNGLEANETSAVLSSGIESQCPPVPSIDTHFSSAWPSSVTFDKLDIPTWSPTRWCFPFSDTQAWVELAPWESMATDHVLMEDFAYPTASQASVDHSELPSIPEASITAPEQLPARSETSTETEGGRERTSLEPASIQEAPRPNYTNHSELSATFAEALGSPASLVRDYSNQNNNKNGKRSNSNDFVTTGLENLSRLAGLTARKLTRREEDWHLEDYDHVPTLPERVYEVIHSNFQMLNTDSGLCRRFTDKELPPLTTMNAFIQSYFEHYNHIFPLIHQPTFDTADTHWVLILAVAATGCGFSQMGNTCTAFILQEFLRRSVNLSIELEPNPDSDSELQIAQSALLSQVGLMFSGNMFFAEHAQRNMSLVPTLCKKANYFVEHQPSSAAPGSPESWLWWIQAESRKRLVYLAWVFDCQLVSFFDLASTMPLDMLQLPMPSHEDLWTAATSDTWSACCSMSYSNKCRPLRQELDILYQHKESPVGTTNLNLLLLTLGVYRDGTDLQTTIESLNILRPAESMNTSEDAFESLIKQHNHALSLLSHLPLRQLNAFSGWRLNPTVRAAVDRQLARWLVDNDEKARMMVYHAAKLLCCLRDHPTNSHHEPMALLTACLALWMFTALGKHTKPTSSPQTLPPTQNSSLLGSDPRPSRLSMAATLRFDKKIEEDMITLWKMGNADLRPFIDGIGSLFEQGASRRLVQETQRVFSMQTGWSLSIAIGMVLRAQYKHNRRVK